MKKIGKFIGEWYQAIEKSGNKKLIDIALIFGLIFGISLFSFSVWNYKNYDSYKKELVANHVVKEVALITRPLSKRMSLFNAFAYTFWGEKETIEQHLTKEISHTVTPHVYGLKWFTGWIVIFDNGRTYLVADFSKKPIIGQKLDDWQRVISVQKRKSFKRAT